jgi:prepilin-type N-terminal cleavage/methylation domain-containing protein
MYNRGFTVLEMMVALALVIVLTGLVFNTVMTTRQAVTRVEDVSDNAVNAAAFFSESGKLLRNIRIDQPFVFERNALRFQSTFQGVDVEVFSGIEVTDQTSVVKVNGVTKALFFGNVEFGFLNENDEWRENWDEEHLPVSVVCALISSTKGISPWEKTFNFLPAIQFTGPRMSEGL